jgi:hypothetical protein
MLQSKLVVVPFSLAMLLVVDVGWGQLLGKERELCRSLRDRISDKLLVAHTILLVDITDPLGARGMGIVKGVISDIEKKLERWEQLSVFTITGVAPSSPQPIFARRNPGRSKDADWWLENATDVENEYKECFKQDLDEATNVLVTTHGYEHSAIMETIASIASLPEFGKSVERRKCIIISDMLQNTKEYSQVIPPFKELNDLSSYKDLIRTRQEIT